MTIYSLGVTRLSGEEPETPTLPTSSWLVARYALFPPSHLALPGDVAAWEAVFGSGGDAIPLPTAIYSCTEGEGSLFDGLHPEVDALKLDPFDEPLYGRRAVGLRVTDGVGAPYLHPLRGVEVAGSRRFQAFDAEAFDPGIDKGVALLAVFRSSFPKEAEPEWSPMAGKLEPGETVGTGYVLGLDANGKPAWRIEDGSATHGVTVDLEADDGAWHCALAVVSRNAGDNELVLQLYSDRGQGEGSAAGASLDLGAETPLRIGALESDEARRFQIAYLAVWMFEGLAPESLADGTAFSRFWTAFAPPRNLVDPPKDALELTRGATVAWPAGRVEGLGEVAARSSGGAPGDGIPHQYPYAALGRGTPPDGGFGCQTGGLANDLLWSESFTDDSWTKAGAEVAVEPVDGPDGMRTANRVSFTLPAEAPFVAAISQAAQTPDTGTWTASIWLRVESVPSPATGLLLRLGSLGEDTDEDYLELPLDDQEILPHGEWIRLHHTFEAGDAGLAGLRVSIAGESAATVEIDLWGAQLEQTDCPGPYLATAGTALFLDGVESSRLVADLSGGSPPYCIGDTGRATFRVRFQYANDVADEKTLLSIPGQAGATDVRIRVLRRRYTSDGDLTHVYLVIEKEDETDGVWARYRSSAAFPDPGPLEVGEVEVGIAWDFTSNTASLDVAGGATEEVVPQGSFSGFEASRLCIGGDEGDDSMTAQVREVKVYSR